MPLSLAHNPPLVGVSTLGAARDLGHLGLQRRGHLRVGDLAWLGVGVGVGVGSGLGLGLGVGYKVRVRVRVRGRIRLGLMCTATRPLPY